MVSGSRFDEGTHILSSRDQKTIQSIKEIVGNHSDAEIYAMLKESNMEPNETTQKLLNQDPFHEVKRRRDRKKENADFRAFKENSTGNKGKNAIVLQRNERNGQSQHSHDHCQSILEPDAPYVDLPNQNAKNLIRNLNYQHRPFQQHFQNKNTRYGTSFHRFQSRNFENKGYARNTTPGIIQEFRIVRDNRAKQNSTKDGDTPLTQCSSKDQTVVNAIEILTVEKPCDERHVDMTVSEAQTPTKLPSGYYHSKQSQLGSSSSKVYSNPGPSEDIQPTCSTSNFTSQSHYQSNSELYSEASTSNNTIVGLYSSSTDPVHVPSPDSRSSSSIGAIKREVGVVGVRWKTSKPSSTKSPISSGSSHPQHLGMNLSPLESSTVKSNQFHQSSMSESSIPDASLSRSLLSGQSNNKPNQQVGVTQRAVQSNMEWKPKVTQKIILDSPRDDSTTRSSIGISNISKIEEVQLFEEFSQISIHGDQQVIIAQHLQLPEANRPCVTFGSFGDGNDSSQGLTAKVAMIVNSKDETSPSLVSASSESGSSTNHKDIRDDHSRNSRSFSPKLTSITESPLSKSESLNPEDSSYNSHLGLVQTHEAESQHQFKTPSVSNLPSYDPHTGYCVPLLSTEMEGSLQGQGITPSQEALSSHVPSNIPPSTIAMIQQPQAVTQMYPQVHVSHFPNFMQYRHFLSHVYMPPMAVPNYSSNPSGFGHIPTSSNYLLMHGVNSHMANGGMKYAVPQYKPVPVGAPAVYGYSNPTGYPISPSGTVGGPTIVDEVPRMKYKESNLFVPNPQAESSEIWVQTPREIPSIPSSSYYNFPGQAPHPAAAYIQPHSSHTSFNAGPQSSQVQFPGLYHPQSGTITSSHHLVHQPSQLGHMNWPTNF